MTRRQRRALLVLSSAAIGGLAIMLTLFALGDQVTFFYSPSDLRTKKIGDGQRFNLGGLVEAGSVDKSVAGVLRFRVSDGQASIVVKYQGVIPDLFREGQGVVATGKLAGDVFAASTIMAKHDENYMPQEVAKALKDRGVWKHGTPAPHPNQAPARPTP